MTAQLILRIVGFLTAGLILVVGIIILAGALVPESIPSTLRTLLGVVMIVYGTFRLGMIAMKFRSERRVQQ